MRGRCAGVCIGVLPASLLHFLYSNFFATVADTIYYVVDSTSLSIVISHLYSYYLSTLALLVVDYGRLELEYILQISKRMPPNRSYLKRFAKSKPSNRDYWRRQTILASMVPYKRAHIPANCMNNLEPPSKQNSIQPPLPPLPICL